MKATSGSGRRPKATQTAGLAAPRVLKSVATAPPPELREALAEACASIQMLEKAIITAEQAEEEENSRYKTLIDACSKGDESTVRALLAAGLGVNRHNKQGVTPLHVAAFNGRLSVVRLLLEQGADVDPPLGEIQSKFGFSFAGATPWFLAKANQKRAVAELLYSYGANPTVTMGPDLTWQAVLEVFTKAGSVSMTL